MLAHCVAQTRCQHLGLLVGQQAGLRSLGLVGLLVRYSPDVGTALRNLVRYLHLFVQGAVVSLKVDGDWAIFGYSVIAPHAEAADQVGDGAVAVIFNIMRELCGNDWKPSEAWFAHQRPENVEPFRRFFKSNLRFDAGQNGLVFSAACLTNPMSNADAELRGILQQQINALDDRHGEDFPEQVRTILRAAVASGYAKADQVAALFSMHPRTFHRRLDAFKTSFHELLDETRFQIARQMLENSSLELSEIATALDYADARSFIRAFRRWSDTTPANWRVTQKDLRSARGSQRGRRISSSTSS